MFAAPWSPWSDKATTKGNFYRAEVTWQMELYALALGLFITHSNLSKMKRITGLLMVFCFALCMAAPTVNASVFDDDVGVDIHQGVAFTQGVFVTDLPEIATPAIAHVMILQSECSPSLPAKKANYKECPNVMRTVTFWHGGIPKRVDVARPTMLITTAQPRLWSTIPRNTEKETSDCRARPKPKGMFRVKFKAQPCKVGFFVAAPK